jgi:ribosome-associated translation inhibitor RaiA
MQVPLTMSFHNLQVSEAIRSACWHEAEKLERYFGRIISCHVTVSRSHRHRQGNPFDLRVHLCVPGQELVVDRKAPGHADAAEHPLLVREAFDELRRRLQDYSRRRRDETRRHRQAVS